MIGESVSNETDQRGSLLTVTVYFTLIPTASNSHDGVDDEDKEEEVVDGNIDDHQDISAALLLVVRDDSSASLDDHDDARKFLRVLAVMLVMVISLGGTPALVASAVVMAD